jgi:NSS family neurotransmitter:Na+ symporter
MGFVIFPKILHFLGAGAQVLGVLFFFCVFIAGVTGVFSIAESLIGNIQVEFRKSRSFAALVSMAILMGGATLFCFGNGQAIIGALAPLLLGSNMLMGGLLEILFFLWLSQEIRQNPAWPRSCSWLLMYCAPLILTTILVCALAMEWAGSFGLAEAIRWGWFTAALSLSGCIAFRKRRVSLLEQKDGA